MLKSLGRFAVAWLVTTTVCGVARPQTPPGPGQEPIVGRLSPPRRGDVYGAYRDAYIQGAAPVPWTPGAGAPGEPPPTFLQRLLGRSEFRRLYFSGDYIHWRRGRVGANLPLVYTSQNLFFDDFLLDPNFLRRLNEREDLNLLPRPLQAILPSLLAPGVSPNLFGIFIGSGGRNNPNGMDPLVVTRINVPVGEILTPYEIRMETDDFRNGWEEGYRPTIGIELEGGDRIEVSYTHLRQFDGGTLLQDARNAAFFMFLVRSSPPPVAALQRFGYLSSPFRAQIEVNRNDQGVGLDRDFLFGNQQDPFAGEVRREVLTVATSFVLPNFPPFEDPSLTSPPLPLATPPRSGDIPREPTNSDNFVLASSPFSLLYQDGELAIANYVSTLQTAEILYRHRIFRWQFANTSWDFLSGLRYVKLDERFEFFFADTVFDRQVANFGNPDTQTAAEVQANYTAAIDNDLLGPQVGLDVRIPMLGFFHLDVQGKGTFALNFQENRISLFRGDGLVYVDATKDIVDTSGIIEGRVGLLIQPVEYVTLRGGFEFLWLLNVGSAFGQIDFDVRREATNRPSNNENILYHGLYAGAEIIF